jgi:hypothetical protein
VGYNAQNTVIDVTIERKHEFMSFRSEPFNTWQKQSSQMQRFSEYPLIPWDVVLFLWELFN